MSSDMNPRWVGQERRKRKFVDASWQAIIEQEKAALARILHDGTGGMLVAARMDISWSETHIHLAPAGLCERLERARRAIDEAIDLNRKLVEELHPTILDNFGLQEALRLHMSSICNSANIPFDTTLPLSSTVVAPLTAIVLYRITQSVVGLLVVHRSCYVSLNLVIEDEWAILSLDGLGMHDAFALEEEKIAEAIAAVQSRVISLGGDMFLHLENNEFTLSCRVPFSTA
jgi:signal transduction histidine kinase